MNAPPFPDSDVLITGVLTTGVLIPGVLPTWQMKDVDIDGGRLTPRNADVGLTQDKA
ncbi:hypothetical protein [Bradyrhizobium sp.]|uniref:hypothetical protein n=1 Tax=Bradyrhizobium sp. TaxID=376 RepID=UPI003C5ACBC7